MNGEKAVDPLIKLTTPVKLFLFIWMVVVILIHLIRFTPPVILKLAEYLNAGESLTRMQEVVEPFFITTDLSAYYKKE